MRPLMSDPTGGERARAIWAHPGAPQTILDPMDPNYGMPASDELRNMNDPPYRFDPTNPAHGELTSSAVRR
jgi:hypothetical protein